MRAIANAWVTQIGDDNMLPGFNFRTGKSDPSELIDPKLQHVRARNPLLYRGSIFTNDAARVEYHSRDILLPNELNLRLPPEQLMWHAPEGFDETKFNVSERIRALEAEFQSVLQREQAATLGTSNTAASTLRTNTLLPYPIARGQRRLPRRARKRAIVELSSDIDETLSQDSAASERSGSCSPDSSSSEVDSPRTRSQRQSRNQDTASSDSGDEADGSSSCSERQRRGQSLRHARSQPQTRSR
jgi:hypothetical protein